MPPQSPHLAGCAPAELSSWLLEHRFQGDQTETTTFLLEAIAGLPDAARISDEFVARTATAPSDAPEVGPAPDPSQALLAAPVVVSCSTPRGRFRLTPLGGGGGIVFEEVLRVPLAAAPTAPAAAAAPVAVTPPAARPQRFTVAAVEHFLAFPRPRDCQPQKKLPPETVLLVLPEKSGVTYKGKPLVQLCFQLPEEAPVLRRRRTSDGAMDDDDDDGLATDGLDLTDRWTQVFSRALGNLDPRSIIRVINPARPAAAQDPHFWRYQYCSYQDEAVSTTTGGLPFVPCHLGVRDGALYPLREGLLFVAAPPLFLPRARLAAIAAGGGAGGSGRYVELCVTTEGVDGGDGGGGAPLAFSNIHRSELPVLNEYIHGTLVPAMARDAAGDDNGGSGAAPAPIEGAESSDADGEAAAPARGRRPTRRAGLEARRINRDALSRGDAPAESDGESSDEDFARAGASDDEEDDASSDSDDGSDGDGPMESGSDEDTESEAEEGADEGTPKSKRSRTE